MNILRALTDPITPLYFFGACVVFLGLFILAKMPKSFWEGMTALSSMLALIGLVGLTGSARMNFAEREVPHEQEALSLAFKSASVLAHRFADHYTGIVGRIDTIYPGDQQKARDAEQYFKRAAGLIDKGYASGAWRELLDQDALTPRSREQRGELDDKLGIRSTADGSFNPYFTQKDWMLSELREVVSTEGALKESEQAKLRSDTEATLSLFWPYLVAISLAIQFTKAFATIRGFREPNEVAKL